MTSISKPMHDDGAVLRRTADAPATWPLLSPVALLRDLWQHRTLIRQFSQTSLTAGNRDSFLGQAWVVLDPLIMLAIYGLVFGRLFHSNVFHIYAGMVTYQLFAQSMNASAGAVISARNYVKQLVFPIQVMPIATVGGLLIAQVIGFVLLIVAQLIFYQTFHWQIILLPVVILPVLFFAMGAAWLFGALGVFIPDIRKIAAVLTQMGFFLTPIVWPLDRFPEKYKWIVLLNPMTPLVEAVRDITLRGTLPAWGTWLVILVISWVVCQFGYLFFRKVSRGFADVL